MGMNHIDVIGPVGAVFHRIDRDGCRHRHRMVSNRPTIAGPKAIA